MTSILSSVSSQITNNIFSRMDSKNQGYIEKTDLATAFSSVNSSKEDSDTEALFSSIDTDNDGKITKSEMSTKIESLLGQLTNNAYQSKQMPPPPSGMQGMWGMPPPPPPSGEDKGVTQEQASEIAASTDDERLSSIMTEISENFEAADANSDGTVTREEGMAYHEANKETLVSSSSGTDTASAESDSSSKNNELYELQMRLAQLIEAYGLGSTEESSSILASA